MSDIDVASSAGAEGTEHIDEAAVAALTAPVPEMIGDGGPELVQLLTPEGERRDHPVYAPYLEGLDADTLRGFYRDLVLVRRVDAEATALQRQGELGIWASLLG
ncbi:MAG: pyruvate dehydrogenase (acetyl-transferring) E1 component subunit alpha, partial [Oryzihumus sp.]